MGCKVVGFSLLCLANITMSFGQDVFPFRGFGSPGSGGGGPPGGRFGSGNGGPFRGPFRPGGGGFGAQPGGGSYGGQPGEESFGGQPGEGSYGGQPGGGSFGGRPGGGGFGGQPGGGGFREGPGGSFGGGPGGGFGGRPGGGFGGRPGGGPRGPREMEFGGEPGEEGFRRRPHHGPPPSKFPSCSEWDEKIRNGVKTIMKDETTNMEECIEEGKFLECMWNYMMMAVQNTGDDERPSAECVQEVEVFYKMNSPATAM